MGTPTVPTMTNLDTDGPPIRDFTRKRKRIVFRIDDDVFEAAPALPGKTLAEFATRFADIEKIPVAQQLDVFADAISLVLFPESNARFQERLNDRAHPIELEQASDVIAWLMEEYGHRPTEPSSPSSPGLPSPASGTSSTDAQQQPVPIPATFQPTAS